MYFLALIFFLVCPAFSQFTFYNYGRGRFCRGPGQQCMRDYDCCGSQQCYYGVCRNELASDACLLDTVPCFENKQCCSNHCGRDGRCHASERIPPKCKHNGFCTSDNECCSKHCTPYGLCRDTRPTCGRTGSRCQRHDQCCSRYCGTNKVCTVIESSAPRPCRGIGKLCFDNGHCCSGYCGRDLKCHVRGGGRRIPNRRPGALFIPEDYICMRPGQQCFGITDCCSGLSCHIILGICVDRRYSNNFVQDICIPENNVCKKDEDCCSKKCEELVCGKPKRKLLLPDKICYGKGHKCLVDAHCCSRNCGKHNICDLGTSTTDTSIVTFSTKRNRKTKIRG